MLSDFSTTPAGFAAKLRLLSATYGRDNAARVLLAVYEERETSRGVRGDDSRYVRGIAAPRRGEARRDAIKQRAA